MNSRISRRDVLKLAGGAGLGILLSPLPWKLLDDSAIWTQNWPWIPEPAHGELHFVSSACTLCSAGCGIRVRCAGSRAISLHGVPNHPVSGGALCALGLLGHHLRFHPARITAPVRLAAGTTIATPMDAESVLRSITEALAPARAAHGDPQIAIVDTRPGRAASVRLMNLATELGCAVYLPENDQRECAEGGWAPQSAQALDIASARTVLSFRAPLVDGWGSPARASRILDRRQGVAGTTPLRLIQVESAPSRTALFADSWLTPRPGTEAVLALAIARVMLDERLVPEQVRRSTADLPAFTAFVAPYTVEHAAEESGIAAETIRIVARQFAAEGPSVALAETGNGFTGNAEGLQFAVRCLNLFSGTGIHHRRSITAVAGEATRKDVPTRSLEELNDHSLRLVIMDESLSGSTQNDSLLKRKLIEENGVILTLSPFIVARPYATTFILPSPAFGEALTDVPGVDDHGNTTLAIAAPFSKAPEQTYDTLLFSNALRSVAGLPAAGGAQTSEELLRSRVNGLHHAKAGSIFQAASASTVEVRALASADDLWNGLLAGGMWMDATRPKPAGHAIHLLPESAHRARIEESLRNRRTAETDGNMLTLVPFEDPMLRGAAVVSPLISKLQEESGLRPFAHQAYVHPETAEHLGLVEGEAALLETSAARLHVVVRTDNTVGRGIVMASCTSPATGQEPGLTAMSQALVPSSVEVVKLLKA